ncbi:MAG: Verru_Chthon cassette protein A, partial [Verrucomicrobiaceae bacterium]
GDPFALIKPEDTVVGLEPAGVAGKDPTSGDTRMVEGLQVVPSSRFQAHKDYGVAGTQFAHSLLSAVGVPYNGGRYGKLVPVASYQQVGSILRQPDVPSRVVQTVTRNDGGPGDWDTGLGDQKDGAYINKPDEGDTAFDSDRGNIPYLFGFGKGYETANNTYFSPNRMIPSPMMLGSIPTGVQRNLPWQTLLFHPRPEDASHPGKATPPDHLIADLFWMPVVEPYAISTPFATAGKINLNYKIEPFRHIRRDTGLRAVMKSTKFLAIATGDATGYKPLDKGSSGTRIPNRRQTIDLDATLAEFETKFANNEVFRSASQISEVNLIPPRESSATMATFWRRYLLTGDNVREKPYVDLYSRLTTRSNAFTVHVRVQALKKARGTAPDQWVAGRDQVLSEYRGSSLIERYIDVNDARLPDFAKLAATSPNAPELNIDKYYRMRVVSTKRFSP